MESVVVPMMEIYTMNIVHMIYILHYGDRKQ